MTSKPLKLRPYARLLTMRALVLVFRGRYPDARAALAVARDALVALGGDVHVGVTLALPEAWLALAEHRLTDGFAAHVGAHEMH